MEDKADNLRAEMGVRFSWDYEKYSEPDQWFLMAGAYQECTCHLLGEMAARKLASSFPHLKVVVSLFEHAVELFLKGAMAQAGKKVPTRHRLDELYGQPPSRKEVVSWMKPSHRT